MPSPKDYLQKKILHSELNKLHLRQLGQTNLNLPILSFGGAPLGELFDRVSETQSRETLASAWSVGIRYYDTAPWYGHGLSEHRIGGLLRQQDQDEFICSTKVGRIYSRFQGRAKDFNGAPWTGGLPFTLKFDYTYDEILRSYEDSLLRFGLNRIDVLVIHDLDRIYHRTEKHIQQRFLELESGCKAFDELKRTEEIRAFGAGINDKSIEVTDAADIDRHTKTNLIQIHHAEVDPSSKQFLKKDQYVDTLNEPSHQELCDLEQQMFLDAIEKDRDLSEPMEAAINSLKIVLAAEESIQTGQAIYF